MRKSRWKNSFACSFLYWIIVFKLGPVKQDVLFIQTKVFPNPVSSLGSYISNSLAVFKVSYKPFHKYTIPIFLLDFWFKHFPSSSQIFCWTDSLRKLPIHWHLYQFLLPGAFSFELIRFHFSLFCNKGIFS